MASDSRRAKVIAEIAELQRLQRGSNHRAASGGWTQQSEAWYEMRAARISALRREREALDQRRGLMNAEDQARKLCERAAASRDPDELAEILAELRALTRQHFAHVEELIEERRHRANRENKPGQERVKTGLIETKAK